MLYPNKKKLSPEDFRTPSKEYRGAPFWSWNCDLDREELLRQIDELHEMGFGGAHIHVRTGLGTPYLGKEFLDLVEASAEKAEKIGMLTYLYDEDRWPSGYAGGLVTAEHPEYRRRTLFFAPEHTENAAYTVGRFDVELNGDGTLKSYRLLSEGETAAHDEWIADVVVEAPNIRFNNATYVDTLNPEAIRAFLRETYDIYKARLGKRFGKSVPSIFTDEPQYAAQSMLPLSHARMPVTLTWTDDLPKTFAEAYGGADLVAHLPELVWNLPEDRPSAVRWQYHDHVCERFARAYSDQIGQWCEQNGILFTGHCMEEDNLTIQTQRGGEVMRFYRGMGVPGIDMLCGAHHYQTAKQCQSAVRQYGRDGMMSELYGVLGYDLDFRGHKHHGDWQAALGVTLRVPHLSLVSMLGEAKRDYPQSIHYQSPWYRKYPLIEDHFARVNTALTRGKAVARVAVIHPIESLWLHFGASDRNSMQTQQLETNFSDVTRWLLFGGVDFDYISESLFPSLTEKGGNPLSVGKCAYDVVIVPECETLRSTTLDRLEAFRGAGGRLIFLGAAPTAENAVPSNRGTALYESSVRLPFSRAALLNALEPYRDVTLLNANGTFTDNLLYQLREDGDVRWLFLAHGILPEKDFPARQDIRIRLRGRYRAELYDTLTGEIHPMDSAINGDRTELCAGLWEYDSLLIRLTAADESFSVEKPPVAGKTVAVNVPAKVSFRLAEPNAFLLDTAEYALDGGEWQPEEEILRIDTACRKKLEWPKKVGNSVQPWATPQEPAEHRIAFRFTIQSEIESDSVLLAVEQPEKTAIRWNGEAVPSVPVGYYTDRSIRTIALPVLKRGQNRLELEMPFEKRIPPEWCYLLGNFGVRVEGRAKTVTTAPAAIGFGSITEMGMPFYGGAITYEIPLEIPESGNLKIHVPQYRAAVLEASVDNGNVQTFAFSPYTADLGRVETGRHTLRLTAYINRTNTFGAVHNTEPIVRPNGTTIWYGPPLWRTTGDRWSYEYNLQPEGVIHSPVVTLETDAE